MLRGRSFYGRAERLVAGGRVVLAFFSLLAIFVDPSEPSKFRDLTYGLMSLYALYALGVAGLVWRSALRSRIFQIATHTIDVAIFSIFIYLTEGHTSPFFLYFVFSLFCAVLRFRARGVFWTAVAAVSIYLAMGISVGHVFEDPGFETNRFIIRSVYLMVAASLLYFLGRHHEQAQEELLALAGWPHLSPKKAEAVAADIASRAALLFPAPRVVVGWEDDESEQSFIASRDSTSLASVRIEVPPRLTATGRSFFVAGGSNSSTALVHSREGRFEPLELDPQEAGLLPQAEGLIGVTTEGKFASGWILLLDLPEAAEEELVLAEVLATLAGARIDQFLQSKMLEKAAVAEDRVRLGRDLHDSLLQSLTGAALQLQSLHKLIDRDPGAAKDRLADVQKVISADQRELRTFVRTLQQELDEQKLPPLEDRLAGLVRRSEAQWGAAVTIDGPGTELSERLEQEVFSLVSEAVANSARHGSASRIIVTIAHSGESTLLTVEDNGSGFPFHGSFDLDTLFALKRGPVSLKERVAALGGTMRVTSSSEGATVEIELKEGRRTISAEDTARGRR